MLKNMQSSLAAIVLVSKVVYKLLTNLLANLD
jgi:hypothetical protein